MRRKSSKVFKIVLAVVLPILIIALLGGGGYWFVTAYTFSIRMSYVEKIDIELAQGAEVKNTILMIGDGMGAAHIEAAKAYLDGEPIFMETFLMQGRMTTFSKTGTTDSAASATALSTGQKIYNGGIAMDCGKELETLAEYAMSQGKSVGIIATEGVDGATPAGFSAHAKNRDDKDTITESQLSSGIDLFMGANKSYYQSWETKIENAGYDYVTSYADLDESADKVFAAFDEIATSQATDSKPSLMVMVEFAIRYLESKSDNGYFLMIEGSHIDKRSHANDIIGTLDQLVAFDEAVGVVIAATVMVSNPDTYVLVTADHETGDLLYSGETKAELNDGMYRSGNHTNKKVRYFATDQIINLPDVIDSTNIASIYRQLMNG